MTKTQKPKKNQPQHKSSSTKIRRLKQPTYTSFRLHKKIIHPYAQLPTARQLWKQTLRDVQARSKLYLGISGVYLFLTLVLVQGFKLNLDIAASKSVLDELYPTFSGKAGNVATLFGQLVNGSGDVGNVNASLYQSIIIIMVVLALVWVIRQAPNTNIKVKDAFYRGMGPVVPFVLVLLVMGLQLLPAGIAGWLYTGTITGGLAVTAIEKLLWIILVLLLLTLSMYLISSSLFALYIVTLEGMTPMRALRSARGLVQHRRWSVARLFAGMGLTLFLLGILVMLPFLLFAPILAEPVFLVVSSVGLVLPVLFLYNVYLGLIDVKTR